MMFKKRFKEHAKDNFDNIVQDPSYIKKQNSIKKPAPLKNKLIPAISVSLAVVLAGVITITIIVPKAMKNDGKSINQSSSILPPNIPEETFYVTKTNNQGLAICEGIDYPEPLKNYKETDSFNVDIMLANLYYVTNNDGTTQLLVGSEEKPGYSFDAINVSLNDSKKQLIQDYSVDVVEYSKQENGIEKDKSNIGESDFRLKYSFDLLDIFKGTYDDNVYFEINYVENSGENPIRIFGKSFSLYLKKNQTSIEVNNLECDSQTSSSQIPDGEIHYMDVIDALSSQPFDYENPNYANAMIHLWDARVYRFNSSQAYSIISNFNSVSLKNIVSSPSYKEELKEKMFLDSIYIVVSYQYINKSDNSEDAVIDFFIAKDGTLALKDHRNIFLYYSDVSVVDYNYIKELVQDGTGD